MKMIDWQALPRGTMTDFGELLCTKWSGTPARLYGLILSDDNARELPIEVLRIAPAKRWTYHDGGPCPVPEGIIVEAMWGEIARPIYETVRGAQLERERLGRNG